MIESIKNVISKSLDLFKGNSKEIFVFNIIFLFVFTLLGRILAVGMLYFHSIFYTIKPDALLTLFANFQNLPLDSLSQYANGIVIISLGLYAIYLFDTINITKRIPAFLDFFSFIKNKTPFRLALFVFSLLTIILNGGILTVHYNSDTLSFFDFILEYPGINIYNHGPVYIIKILDNLIFELLIFLPYIIAMYIIVNYFIKSTAIDFLKKYKKNILVLFIIVFCIDAIYIHFLDTLNHSIRSVLTVLDIKRDLEFYTILKSIIVQATCFILISYFLVLIVGIILYSSNVAVKNDYDLKIIKS